MKLNAIYKINELGMVAIHDMNGEALLYMAYQNRNKAEEIIKRVNEYDELKRRIENQKCSIISYEEELQQKKALIRELAEKLEIVVATYEMGYMLNDVMIEDIKDTLEKYEQKIQHEQYKKFKETLEKREKELREEVYQKEPIQRILAEEKTKEVE